MESREIDTTMTPILSKYQYQKPKDFGVYVERCYPVSAVMDMLKEYSDQQNKHQIECTEHIKEVCDDYEKQNKQLLDEIDELKKKYTEHLNINKSLSKTITESLEFIDKLQSELKDKDSVISDLKQAMIKGKDLNDKLTFD